MIDLLYLHDPFNHSLHPGGLGVQANLLACLFQSGTATSSKTQSEPVHDCRQVTMTKSKKCQHHRCLDRLQNEVLHDLSLLAVGVGRNQLHLLDVAADGFALRHDAAAVQLHSQASQAHPC